MATACLGCGSWLQENHWKPDEVPRCFKCEANALRAEIERLKAENAKHTGELIESLAAANIENARLRRQVERLETGYRDAYVEGVDEFHAQLPDEEISNLWRSSKSKKRLDAILADEPGEHTEQETE